MAALYNYQMNLSLFEKTRYTCLAVPWKAKQTIALLEKSSSPNILYVEPKNVNTNIKIKIIDDLKFENRISLSKIINKRINSTRDINDPLLLNSKSGRNRAFENIKKYLNCFLSLRK